jgi:hypothetical protein
MTNTTTLLKVTAVWVTAVYLVCFLGIIAFPALRDWFLLYGLHVQPSGVASVTTVTTFVSGLVVWNVVAAVAMYMWSFTWRKLA